jgi:hypothetical protein
MKRIIGILLLSQSIAFAQTPSQLLHYGGSQNDLSYGLCKGNGNTFFTSGYFTGSVAFGSSTLVSNGNEDIYIAKHDSAGQIIWARSAGGAATDMSFSLSYHNGYAYITGVFTGSALFGTTTLSSSGQTDGFIAKYDESGNLIWAKKAGASVGLDRTDEIAFEGENTMYLCASLAGSASYAGTSLSGNGGIDAYILKLDTAGNLLKYTNIGGSSNDYSYDLKYANGGLYITGNYASNSIDFGGATKGNSGSYDSYVAKYDTALTMVWSNVGGGSGLDDFEKLIVDSTGNCYVTGYITGQAFFSGMEVNATMTGGRDGCIVKYNPSGSIVWVKTLGTHSGGAGREIKFGETQNEIVVYGHFSVSIANDSQTIASNGLLDGLMLEYNPSGEVISLLTFGGSGAESICEVAKIGNTIWVSGGMDGLSVFNGLSVTSNGVTDIGLWEFKKSMMSTGISEKAVPQTGFKMFPNPTQHAVVFQSEYMIHSVEIYNLVGEKIVERFADSKEVFIETELTNGLYFVVMNGEINHAQKLLIQY